MPRHNEMKPGATSSSGVFYEAFCGTAAKYEAQLTLHEATLRAMKQSLAASFAIFWAKKMAGEIFIATSHSEPLFEAENSEFRCEMKF